MGHFFFLFDFHLGLSSKRRVSGAKSLPQRHLCDPGSPGKLLSFQDPLLSWLQLYKTVMGVPRDNVCLRVWLFARERI